MFVCASPRTYSSLVSLIIVAFAFTLALITFARLLAVTPANRRLPGSKIRQRDRTAPHRRRG